MQNGRSDMTASRNPFTPTFGVVPFVMAGRDEQISNILNALDNGPGDPNLSTIFIGARGTGKTALLMYLARQAQQYGWIAVSVSALPGMLEDIYEQSLEKARGFVSSENQHHLAGVNDGGVFGVSWERSSPETGNWRTRMTRLLNELEEHNVGLLITVDEVRVTLDEMVALAATYQLFVGEGRRIGLLMAGLPHQVSALLRNENISFLRRAVQYHMERIPDYEVIDALRKTIEAEGRTASDQELARMAEASQGFPYMIQLVGSRVWSQHPEMKRISSQDVKRGIDMARNDMRTRVLDATYRELSEGDLRFLEAMLEDEGASRVSDIAHRLGVSSGYAAQYKRRLLEQGVIGERGRGIVDFDIPFFREYLEGMRSSE